MFKSRLKEAGINILIFLGIIAVIVLFGSIGYFLDSKIPISDEVAIWVIKAIGIVVGVYFIYKAIVNIVKFINWLFIEPFKKVK